MEEKELAGIRTARVFDTAVLSPGTLIELKTIDTNSFINKGVVFRGVVSSSNEIKLSVNGMAFKSCTNGMYNPTIVSNGTVSLEDVLDKKLELVIYDVY